MKKSHKITLAVLAIVLIISAGAYAISISNENNIKPKVEVSSNQTNTNVAKSEVNSTSSTKTDEELLIYLIEEEKLAHDVYTVMYQKYGANVFGNILESETSHQGKVLVLLQARNIQDPRSTELGVFKNTELQKLYDSLIAQGNTSATEAYKVGVIIEEKDIADISNQLATTSDQEIVATLESLRSGSENHLRAFNRQLKV